MRFLSFLLPGMILTGALHAEYIRVDQDFDTMDCASCATFVENKLAKNAGVEKVTLDAKKGQLVVLLKPGNTVKYSQVRDFVQQSGYKPKEGRVIVRGIARMNTGIGSFEVAGLRETLRVRDDDTVLRELFNKQIEAVGKIEKVDSNGTMIDIFVVVSARVLP